MNYFKLIVGVLLAGACVWAAYGQTHVKQVTAKDNRSCNNTCSVIDAPELNATPSAIIFLTPLGDSTKINPHPVGAYFMYLKKWSVLNLDGTPIPDGAQYDVEYYTAPDSTHFSYTVGQNPIGMGPGSGPCLDRPGLNRNSVAQVKVSPTSSPTRGSWFNSSRVTARYDQTAMKWCLATDDGSAVKGETVYNIAFKAGTSASAQAPPPIGSPVGTPVQTTPMSTLVPQLAPLAVIVRTEWPLPPLILQGYQGVPKIGYGACMMMSAKFTDPAILATDTVIITGQAAGDGQGLTWTGNVENGAIQIFACSNIKVTFNAEGHQFEKTFDVTGKKINILVVP